MNKFCLLIFLYFAIFVQNSSAQQSINTTGGDIYGSGGSVAFSIGQIVFQTYNSPAGSEAQGIQQPHEISIVSGINDQINPNYSVSLFPNPTNGCIQLNIETENIADMSFQLYDVNSKLLFKGNISRNQTSISMKDYLPAIYFLKVIQGKKEIITFKIIKTN